jgi:hypothetical protein
MSGEGAIATSASSASASSRFPSSDSPDSMADWFTEPVFT